jgi:hypothetical protein
MLFLYVEVVYDTSLGTTTRAARGGSLLEGQRILYTRVG